MRPHLGPERCHACRALYAVLLSPEVARTTKAPMFLALLFKVRISPLFLFYLPAHDASWPLAAAQLIIFL